MNAKRLAELNDHPERATFGELLLAWAFTLLAFGFGAGLVTCAIVRILR
jgi:hypothetical protein